MPKRKITLLDFIVEIGPNKLARKLKINESTVRQWRRGYCLPRAEYMLKINRLTKGRLTYAEMIETHFKNRKI